ncbi:MAG: nucleoside 2-deoxyribosyltransferase [Gemmatimonadales bacterium]
MSPDELQAIIEQAIKLGLVDRPPYKHGAYALTPAGWRRVGELRKTGALGNQAFVAMWFDPQMDAAWEIGIEKALTDTGWLPMKINRKEHNNRIDDEIIAEIRRSGLIVADFTGFRSGVFFEAGFGLGLGMPVIWTVQEDEELSKHFDTRQYNHITWKDPQDLYTKLVNRIRATAPVNRPQ